MEVTSMLGDKIDYTNIDDLCFMKLNDSISLDYIKERHQVKLTITKVFGGWNYVYFSDDDISTVFVKGSSDELEKELKRRKKEDSKPFIIC